MENNTGLIFKWLKSENCSSRDSQKIARKIREYLGLTHKQYRKLLSWGREKENILERLMSSNEWDKIDFSKIPSKAGLIYHNAFGRRDILSKKYEIFMKNKNTTVNADTLYPYEIVLKARRANSDTDRKMVEKYWENQKDWFGGKQSNMLCVCDTSGSMTWSAPGNVMSIDVAVSLSIYAAERAGGPFKNHYISFASRPQLIEVRGTDFVDKVERIVRTNLCDNTNLVRTFDMLLEIADRPTTKEEDIPETIVVISDMEIDEGTGNYHYGESNKVLTDMEKVRVKWESHGHKMPKLVYWNVNARNNTILDRGENVSLVSGCSPSIFESIITDKTGIDLMKEALLKERYNCITI